MHACMQARGNRRINYLISTRRRRAEGRRSEVAGGGFGLPPLGDLSALGGVHAEAVETAATGAVHGEAVLLHARGGFHRSRGVAQQQEPQQGQAEQGHAQLVVPCARH
ncbi:hypothetical protein VPH35_046927 [Triticum aestivum]|uniref:Uncharacterized protein n=1 Tax=Triticum urartu TaxID=4572 RepID=A0A8R7U0U9_TRIUA